MNWSAFLTLGILASTIHWIFARSKIMEPFWKLEWLPESKLRWWLNGMLTCAACNGWWLGLAAGVCGLRPLKTEHWLLDTLAAGLCGAWTTPVAEGVLVWGLARSKIE